MRYSTTYYQLDKDNKVLKEYKGVACFGDITSDPHNFEKDCQYLLYDFSNMKVTQEKAQQYFLFLKSIPEFKELMPRSCKTMAETGKFRIDLHKFNGTKVFTILTLIRAVVEDPKIVRAVIEFDRKFKYSISNFSILKMCGSVYTSNSNHWITMQVDKSNLNRMFNTRKHWDSEIPCIKTGLGRNLFSTFIFADEGYATKNPVREADIKVVREEKNKPNKKVHTQKTYDSAYLQLGF